MLHAFQKKSKRSIATPKRELDLIRERLKWAERLHTGKVKEGLSMTAHFEKSSGNVFADLGLPNSEQELLKAELTVQIYKLIKEQKLTQTKAAELLGTTRPKCPP